MSITNTARLKELGYQMPPVPRPLAAYIPALRVGDQVWTAGQLPLTATGLQITGKVGETVTVEEATKAAQQATLNALAAAGSAVGGVDNLTKIIKVTVYVACADDFYDQPKVANGASELLAMVFSRHGLHIRSAVGVRSLPMNSPVEVELICEFAEPEDEDAAPGR